MRVILVYRVGFEMRSCSNIGSGDYQVPGLPCLVWLPRSLVPGFVHPICLITLNGDVGNSPLLFDPIGEQLLSCRYIVRPRIILARRWTWTFLSL